MNDEVIIRVCCYTFGKSEVCPSVWNVPLLWLAHTHAMYIPAWEHLLLIFFLPEIFFPKYLNGSLLHPLQSSIQISPPQWAFLNHAIRICSHPEFSTALSALFYFIALTIISHCIYFIYLFIDHFLQLEYYLYEVRDFHLFYSLFYLHKMTGT